MDIFGCQIPTRYPKGYPGQLILLPLAEWEMSAGQSLVMLCCWGVKAGWLIPFVWVADKTV